MTGAATALREGYRRASRQRMAALAASAGLLLVLTLADLVLGPSGMTLADVWTTLAGPHGADRMNTTILWQIRLPQTLTGILVGASLGLAINGAVMTWALTQQSASLPPDATAALPEGLVGLSPHAATALTEATREVVLSHYTAGFNTMFLWIAAIYVVAAGLTVLLKDIQIPKRG